MPNFEVQSHSGPYQVIFDNTIKTSLHLTTLGTHFIIDQNVWNTLPEDIITVLSNKHITLIEATEENKSYEKIGLVITKLLEQGLKRDSKLVAIGGGITQDITCFIATTFMRGINWVFVPTTLLAQADSCIGSKSSINFGNYKNLLGSFTPPNEVYISNQFLETLEDRDFKSGVGEIIKLFLIGQVKITPGEIVRENVDRYVYECLMIKKEYIEADEFDKGIRNLLNYGHCIGHGIESATNFDIPHGIAVSMGMDAANKLAWAENLITKERYQQMSEILFENYKEFVDTPISIEKVFAAQTKDKKNTGSKINLILPVNNSFIKQGFENNSTFWNELHYVLLQTPINFVAS